MAWWIVGLVEFLWVAGVAIWVATDRRAPASTLAWIVVLAFLPVIGLPVYLLVGPRRLQRQRLRYQGLSESVSAALDTVERHSDIPPDVARQVRLAARLDEGRLRLAVADTGVGLREGGSGTGFGLENVRQRLRALFGEAASLDVRENSGGGVVATLEIPA